MSFVSRASWAAGYIPELPTPFDKAGALDLSSLSKLCERLVEADVSAIVLGGAAGEASSLSLDEHEAVVRTAVDVTRGRIRVIAGLGSNATGEAIESTRRAEAGGADAILSEVPRITPRASASMRILMRSQMQRIFRSFFATSSQCTRSLTRR
jgi:4-hydroxy-tetrahydrodipicolinate synthase